MAAHFFGGTFFTEYIHMTLVTKGINCYEKILRALSWKIKFLLQVILFVNDVNKILKLRSGDFRIVFDVYEENLKTEKVVEKNTKMYCSSEFEIIFFLKSSKIKKFVLFHKSSYYCVIFSRAALNWLSLFLKTIID